MLAIFSYDVANDKIVLHNPVFGISSSIANLVEDTTPQLGGPLDGQGEDLTSLGVIFLTEQAAAEADVAGQFQLWAKTATPNRNNFV